MSADTKTKLIDAYKKNREIIFLVLAVVVAVIVYFAPLPDTISLGDKTATLTHQGRLTMTLLGLCHRHVGDGGRLFRGDLDPRDDPHGAAGRHRGHGGGHRQGRRDRARGGRRPGGADQDRVRQQPRLLLPRRLPPDGGLREIGAGRADDARDPPGARDRHPDGRAGLSHHGDGHLHVGHRHGGGGHDDPAGGGALQERRHQAGQKQLRQGAHDRLLLGRGLRRYRDARRVRPQSRSPSDT